MKYLHPMLSRRTFLKLTGQLSVFTITLHGANVVAGSPQQINFQSRGYGVGAYGHSIYAGMSSNVYLPLVSKVQK